MFYLLYNYYMNYMIHHAQSRRWPWEPGPSTTLIHHTIHIVKYRKIRNKSRGLYFFSRFLVKLIYESGLYWADVKLYDKILIRLHILCLAFLGKLNEVALICFISCELKLLKRLQQNVEDIVHWLPFSNWNKKKRTAFHCFDFHVISLLKRL